MSEKKYDTLVSVAVQNDPFGFVDTLHKEADTSSTQAPLLHEAACVIANLFLTHDAWHPQTDSSIAKAIFDWKSELVQIADILGETELLPQLAEESAELGQAALKLRRVLNKKNPTPVSERDARYAISEEIADVILCIATLKVDYEEVEKIVRHKAYRWNMRLRKD